MIEDMIRLDSPIADLKGFGPKSAEKFTKLDLHTVGDLLLYFPFRYEDFKSKSIFELMDGGANGSTSSTGSSHCS